MVPKKNAAAGIAFVGFPLAVLGFILLVGGNVGVGLPFLGAGLGFAVLGMAAWRKATASAEGEGAPPNAGVDGARTGRTDPLEPGGTGQ
jgi:hypothetical protein